MAPGLGGANASQLLGGELHAEHTAALPGYSVGKVIGEGGFCQVRLALHHLSGRKVAVKVIDKAKLTDANEAKRIQREIRVMRHLTHECIIKLFQVVDAPSMLYLVMEHAPNGSLLDHVRARKRLAEPDAAYILQQVVAGLEHCHQREVVHRDVKLENILLDADNVMKVIDFGLSAFFVPDKRLRVHCGSPSYAAPEIVARKHYDGPPVDVWSLGVVLFAMLAGYLPFHSSSGNKQELCAKIMEGKYTAPESLSPHAKDILARQAFLVAYPDKRITLGQLWSHPWVRGATRWEPVGASVYCVLSDPSTGAVYADEQLVDELEASGYPRQMVLQSLLASEVNYLTAAYYLLAEGEWGKQSYTAACAWRPAHHSRPEPLGSGTDLQPRATACSPLAHHVVTLPTNPTPNPRHYMNCAGSPMRAVCWE
ncbi:kinase-like domain-containing protein [Haematococcus lacustris]